MTIRASMKSLMVRAAGVWGMAGGGVGVGDGAGDGVGVGVGVGVG